MRIVFPRALALLGAAAVAHGAQEPGPQEVSISVELRGVVTDVTGSVTGPHYGAARGDRFRATFDVSIPAAEEDPGPGPEAGMRYLDVRPETLTVDVGGTSEAGAAGAEVGLATVTNDSPADTLAFTLHLPSGATLQARAGDETGRALQFLALDRAAPLELGASSFTGSSFRLEDGRAGTFLGRLESITIGGPTALGDAYCASSPNSTGQGAELGALGSPSVEANRVTLMATGLPKDAFGFFLAGQGRATVAQAGGSAGTLCLGEPIGRFVGPGQIRYAGADGEFELQIDLGEIPQPGGSVTVTPGSTWNFQAWHRDPGAGGTSQFTAALEIRFQ